MASNQMVYFFGAGKADGKGDMKNLLGGKGAGLAEMSRLGIPVPAGFTITTEVCTGFYANNRKYPAGLVGQVEANLRKVERAMGAKFGDSVNPLLLSVRSGARVSMPGMMDTVLNLGLNDTTVLGLASQTGNRRFAYDSYRRFVQMYGDVVLGLKPESKDDEDPFEVILERKKHEVGATVDTELDTDALVDLVDRFKEAIRTRTGRLFPEDPKDQLWGAIGAVFGSWDNPRANAYRELNGIPGEWGTAVNVQTMVFGNMGEDSGTGVLFSRNPATGERKLYGEFLMNAQGEDVVAGTRTPHPIHELAKAAPKIYKQIDSITSQIEHHYRDMQDMEFTIQKDRLWMLQTRSGKRTGFAAIKIAADMVAEKLISEADAIRRIAPESLNQLLQPVFDEADKRQALANKRLLAKGLNAGPGAASGKVVFNAEDAEAWAARGEKVILVRIETSPEDIRGMNAAEGILTARGGSTSHAALVARQMGKVCVAGCGDLQIHYRNRNMAVAGRTIAEGDWLSIDGTTGEVIEGRLKTMPSEVVQVLIDKSLPANKSENFKLFQRLMGWADAHRRLKIRTNADQPDQAAGAVAFGAEGIGLCRTEHMFFAEEKIGPMREMILAEDRPARERALAKLLPLQRDDFKGIFKAMEDRPVTIRTLGPPLHEFLPHSEEEIAELSRVMGVSKERLHAKIESLHELNPMLGHRGCRLGISYPEITAMQARAILEAACEVRKETGKTPVPEIMIPFVGDVAELADQEKVVRSVAKAVMAEQKVQIKYLVGTMIELPRAALTADLVAGVAEFFSFGTNDLTQTTMGLSRDDAGKFLPVYIERGFFQVDPFQSIDVVGVGQLVAMATRKGRNTKPDLKVGICGEHGGDPKSIQFFHDVGLNYVSCSPFRVPIARLAAAQAAILETDERKASKAAKPRAKKTARPKAKKAAKPRAKKAARPRAKKAARPKAKKAARPKAKKAARPKAKKAARPKVKKAAKPKAKKATKPKARR
jgi:pyruvate,orthophosphate dikinase